MPESEEIRRDEIFDRLEAGKTIPLDDIRFMVDQTSFVQRLALGTGFVGNFWDELSDTGQEALVQSGQDAQASPFVLTGLGVPPDVAGVNIGIITPTFGRGAFGRAKPPIGPNAYMKDVMAQPTRLSRAVQSARRVPGQAVEGIITHKKGLAVGALAVVGASEIGRQGVIGLQEGRGGGEVSGEKVGDEEPEEPGEPEVGPGGQLIYVTEDGQVINIPPEGVSSLGGGDVAGITPDFSPDLLNAAASLGFDASGLQTGILQKSFLTDLDVTGRGRVSATERPFGVDPRGGRIPSQTAFEERRQGRAGIPEKVARFLPGEDIEEFIGGAAAAPPGAALNRRVFDVRNDAGNLDPTGRTNLERASLAASQFGVPLDILYGNISALSGWNPQAVGNSGANFGLAQIPSDVISPEISIRAQWSLNYLAQRLRDNFGRYGSWEMATLGYRSPEAVSRFLTTGTMERGDKQYLADALGGSAESGLGNNIFDFAGLSAIPTSRGGGGGGGPKIPAFQVPDPAKLREFARGAFASVLGRDPTDGELSLGVEELTSGFRAAYDEDVKRIRGQSSVEISPQDRYLEQLGGSGEASFREEVVTQRSVFDTMGDWARVLREL